MYSVYINNRLFDTFHAVGSATFVRDRIYDIVHKWNWARNNLGMSHTENDKKQWQEICEILEEEFFVYNSGSLEYFQDCTVKEV
jgi:hypothetical protein